MHTRVRVRTVYEKALDHAQKNAHANFEILLISNILKKHFTKKNYYCQDETLFVVHL